MTATQAPTPGPLSASDIAHVRDYWSAICDSDWHLIPANIRDDLEERLAAVGLAEWRAVTDDDLEDTFAYERGIEKGRSCLDLTALGHLAFKSDADGWMPWSGGENPVPGQMVEVKSRWVPEVVVGLQPSDGLSWPDIIAFRLAPTAPVEASGSERWTEDMEWPESPLANDLYQHIQSQFCLHPDEAAEETGEVLSILAKHGVDPTKLPTPARAEAQDEGAVGEPVAWRDVVGFEGLYEVSSDGDVRNAKTGRVQAKNLMGLGYVKAELWRDGVRKQTSVHRVVAEAFLPPVAGFDEVNHIDGNKQNNTASNLEWSDRKSNTDHSRYVLGNDVKAVLAIDPEDGSEEYYPSIEEAGRSGYKASGVYAALNGIKKTHGGKRWVLTEWRNPAHPSPTPAAGADRVRIAVEALERIKAYRVCKESANIWTGATACRAIADEALAALKSTAAKEGGAK